MVRIIWEFEVDASQAAIFELIYGAQGAWAALFHQSDEYHGTLLLKDRTVADRYFTIDQWNSVDAFERFKKHYAKEYKDLDDRCEKLTLTERKIGVFEEI